MSQLFSPFALGNVALSNRIVISPMCQYSAEHGQATDWHLIHLGQLALSGAGLLFIEATAVTPEGRISPGDLGLWSDQTEAALARVIRSIHQYSSMPIAIQLAHAGRKASTQAPWEGGRSIPPARGGWQTVAPSPLPYDENDTLPRELEEDELQRIRNDFVTATQR
ncbi:MAG: oxidoreductase, partial [Sulfurimicrobium sp.]